MSFILFFLITPAVIGVSTFDIDNAGKQLFYFSSELKNVKHNLNNILRLVNLTDVRQLPVPSNYIQRSIYKFQSKFH